MLRGNIQERKQVPTYYVLIKYLLITKLIPRGRFLYYVRVKGWVGGIAKYLLFLTGVGGWFWITLT